MPDGHRFIDAEDLPWGCSHAHGVSFKQLRYDKDGTGAVMVHMCPGTRYPQYITHGGQDVYVVDGELILGELRVQRGAYAFIPAASTNEPHTEKGCVLFVASNGHVKHANAG